MNSDFIKFGNFKGYCVKINYSATVMLIDVFFVVFGKIELYGTELEGISGIDTHTYLLVEYIY